jgi:hypothetical protein
VLYIIIIKMGEQGEISDLDIYGDIVLNTVVALNPGERHYRERVLSGDPEQVYGDCGKAGSGAVAQELSSKLLIKIVRTTSGHEDSNGHMYLLVPDKDLIFDPAAGQFIPKTSRIGFEKYFRGNMFIGPRDVLRQICQKGVINTSTRNNPLLSFQRI